MRSGFDNITFIAKYECDDRRLSDSELNGFEGSKGIETAEVDLEAEDTHSSRIAGNYRYLIHVEYTNPTNSVTTNQPERAGLN